MNKKRRATLKEAVRLLYFAANLLSSVADEEQDALDNIPENLEGSDLYASLSDNIETLESAADSVEDIADSIASL